MKQNVKNGTISEWYNDEKNPKYSRNPDDVLKFFTKSFIQERQTYVTAISKLFSKTYNKKQISNK